MNSLVYYLIQVITCSGILYGYYHFALRNNKFHLFNRYYLLVVTITSFLIPFLTIPIYFPRDETNSSFVVQTFTFISSGDLHEPVSPFSKLPLKNVWFSTKNFACYFYFLVSIIVFIRIMLSLRRIRQIREKYPVEKLNTIYFVNTNEPGTPFSFFRWLFWNQKIELRSEKGEQIFRHEFFHIQQKHSWDVMYMELLTTIFWINPFFYLFKREIKAIHEFLADQFAINQNKKWEYAELLLMQTLNTQQRIVNPFFHNQIKRRIAMITSSKKKSRQYLRKIMVLPVAALAVAFFSFSYKNKKINNSLIAIDKPVKVVIDAGHGLDASGKHNGVRAADGTYEDDIVLSIAKKIKELNTNPRVQIILTREDRNSPDLEKRIAFANSQNPDLFISIHTNTASNQEIDSSGMDVYISRNNIKYYAENKILASILFNYFSQIHAVNDIKQSKAGVYVIDKSNCPSALVECGYLSDQNDLAFMKNEDGQEKIAKSILQSIEQYFLQKDMPDWGERKRVVADTVGPVIKFSRKATRVKLEGTIDGKKIKEINIYEPTGQFVFVLDGEITLISKGNTEALKNQYGKDIDDLITKQPDKAFHEADKIFEKVEIEAAFPGGVAAWNSFLVNNLKESVPADKNAPAGTYTTWIEFIVDTEGRISNIRPLTNHGYGMEEEAVRVMRLSPRWVPAIQNGYRVKAYRKQPVNFNVTK